MDYKIDKIKKYEAKEILNIEYEKYLNDFMDLDAKIDCLVFSFKTEKELKAFRVKFTTRMRTLLRLKYESEVVLYTKKIKNQNCFYVYKGDYRRSTKILKLQNG